MLLAAAVGAPVVSANAAEQLSPSVTSRVVSYVSSVDRFPLSYLEWLPVSYNPHHGYPLVIYLHGMGPGVAPVRGGVGAASVPTALPLTAVGMGAVFISLNTRTDSGFYTNTPCGGPQEQDLLDAVAFEEGIRNVSAVYLVGFSMGASGALAVASDHPAQISGVGVAAPITDFFEEYSYMGGIPQLYHDYCGVAPSPRAGSVVQAFENLSPLRFSPTNLSSVRVYVTAGGLDMAVPNNFSVWPYAHVNSTFVNGSCARAPLLGEPASCTQPLGLLHRLSPSSYLFRYVYESMAWHTPLQLNAADMLGFLFGLGRPGLYTAGFPPLKIVPAP